MALGFEQTYQLRTGDFDTHTRISPASVLDVFQDVAGVNAEQTPGMTSKDLWDGGVFWVVTRIKYEVLEYPRLHERVIARTWPLAPNRLGFQREYTMRRPDGTLLIKCSSEWILMDYATRSFVSAKDFCEQTGQHYEFATEKNFDKKLRKLRTFDLDSEAVQATRVEQTVHFCDLDMNGHVNNSKYPNFVMNALDLPKDQAIRTFQIDYRHELRPGDVVSLYSQRDDDGVTTMAINEQGECAFETKIEFGQFDQAVGIAGADYEEE